MPKEQSSFVHNQKWQAVNESGMTDSPALFPSLTSVIIFHFPDFPFCQGERKVLRVLSRNEINQCTIYQ